MNGYRVSAFKNQSREKWGGTTGIHMGYLAVYITKSVDMVYPWALSEVQSWGADYEH